MLFHNRLVELLLVLKIIIDGRARRIQFAGDIVQIRVVKPVFAKYLFRGVQDILFRDLLPQRFSAHMFNALPVSEIIINVYFIIVAQKYRYVNTKWPKIGKEFSFFHGFSDTCAPDPSLFAAKKPDAAASGFFFSNQLFRSTSAPRRRSRRRSRRPVGR